MAKSGFNFGSSVVKRESKPIEAVEERLLGDGWKKTGEIASGRVRYYQKTGINITAVKGPVATLLMPSGPVRGAFFGDSAVGFNRTSVIGAGSSTDTARTQTKNKSSQHV